MKAFTDTLVTKDEMISTLVWHQTQDNFRKGSFFGSEGKGCAVGCSLESVAMIKKIKVAHGDHKSYESYMGIPEWLARVEDTIFEGLPIERSKQWPVEFIEAINIGSDLDKIKAPFLIFILKSNLENFDNKKFPEVTAAINQCITFWETYPNYSADSAADSAARSAADSAAYSADSAADSAAYSADSAARSAAYSAYSAARSAADSAARSAAYSAAYSADSAARSAARSAAYEKYADKLLELIKGNL